MGRPCHIKMSHHPPKPGAVRDKLGIFSNPTNADIAFVRKRSVMSPVEAPVYMRIPIKDLPATH